MGGEANRVGVELPLTDAERDRIINELEELPNSDLVPTPSMLVGYVEHALQATGEHESLGDFGPYGATHDADVQRIQPLLRDLVSAITAIAPETPPIDPAAHAAWVAFSGSRSNFDAFSAAIRELYPDVASAQQDAIERRFLTAVAMLSTAPVLDASDVDNTVPAQDSDAARIVRAVMYYRHVEGLSLTISWGNAKDDVRIKGKHRTNDELPPTSASARLVYYVAKAFKCQVKNRHLRTLMDRYYQVYSKRDGRKPVLVDISLNFDDINING